MYATIVELINVSGIHIRECFFFEFLLTLKLIK